MEMLLYNLFELSAKKKKKMFYELPVVENKIRGQELHTRGIRPRSEIFLLSVST